MGSTRRTIGAMVAAAALLVAACGSDGQEVEATSPLAEFLGEDVFGGDFDSDEAQARFAEEERQREETIAACMREQGFEYIPRDTSDFAFFSADADGIEYDSREYAEKYGFGITTEWFSQAEVGPELVGWDDARFEDQIDEDPNTAIVEAMDDATRQAYEEALYGDESSFPTFDDTMSDEEIEAQLENFEWEPQGCSGEAFAEDGANNFYQAFDKELQELYETVQQDPRIADKEREISECVADSGYDFSLEDDQFEQLFDRFQNELNEIEQLVGGQPGLEMTEEDFAAMTEEEIDAMFNQPREFSDEAKTRLGELQAEETAMAVAVWDCGGSFGNSELSDLYREVSAEYEQQFIDDNADRLAEYKADQ